MLYPRMVKARNEVMAGDTGKGVTDEDGIDIND